MKRFAAGLVSCAATFLVAHPATAEAGLQPDAGEHVMELDGWPEHA